MASDDPTENNVKKVHERVARASDAAVLMRMRTLGFWPKGEGLPPDPPDEARERAQLEADRTRLLGEVFTSPQEQEQALAKERARRIQESREARKARLAQRAEEAANRRKAWAAERARRLVHAGVDVSGGLQDTEPDTTKLLAAGLPVLRDEFDLAALLGLTVGALRFLTFHRKTATLVHYHRFTLPKKTGGLRAISAPKARLKAAQAAVLRDIVGVAAAPSRLAPEAHGFVAGKNVVTNAQPHVGQQVVINLDLKDFFPSVTFPRVKGLFRELGYGGKVSTLLALLVTEPPRVEMALPDAAAPTTGKRVYVALGARQLPQGACTSPAITNLLCRRLDKRLRGLAAARGFRYTRYADDLTFSSSTGKDVNQLLFAVREILNDEGLAEHPDKTKVMRRGRRHEVTGVVVNARPAVDRRFIRRLRAVLHQAQKEGLAAARRPGPDGQLPSITSFVARLRGQIAWVQMVDRDKGDRLRRSLDAMVAGTSSVTAG